MKTIFIIFFIMLFSLIGCGSKNPPTPSNNEPNHENSSNYTTSKLSVEKPAEETISTFSTTILINDSNRQNNINIACNQLNGTIVKNGKTFSFCDTLGSAKPEDGYKKADGFDSDGDITPTYGGGKCQISSTMYNAVLAVPSLIVVERHPHSAKVDYVESGKDAAVAYGSVDFKFRNDTGYDIRIDTSCTEDNITVTLVKI